MKLLDRIAGYLGYRRHLEQPNFCAVRLRGAAGVLGSFRCDRRAVLAIPAFYSGTRIIANTISSLDLRLLERQGNREASGNPMSLILRRPNQFDTLYDLVQLVICDMVLHGRAYVLIDRNATGAPVRLTYAPCGYVTFRPETGDYGVQGGGNEGDPETRVYDYRDVICFINNYFECSALDYYADAVQLASLLIQNNINYFRNSSRPGLIFKYPVEVEMTDEQRQETVKSIMDTYAGDEGKFTPIVADRGLEVESLDINFANAQVIEQREFVVKEVARLLNIPLSKLGVMGNTKASVSEENSHFVHHTLRPIARIIETKLDRYLLTEQSEQRYRFAFDFNPLLYGTLRDKATAFRVNADLGIFSKQEMRRVVYGLPAEIAEGEEVAVPPNMSTELIGENEQAEGGDADDEEV